MSLAPENEVVAEDFGPIDGTWIYKTGRVITRIATTLMFDFTVHNSRNVPRTGGVLVVGNHQSYLDPILYAVKLPRPMSFMAKSELFENKVFGGLIAKLSAFPVRQGRFDRSSLRQTVNRLRAGRGVVLFPEGSRSESGEIEPLQRGVGLIIRQAGPGVKVVPAAVHGAYQAWDRSRKLPRPWPIHLEYGPPMDLSNLDDREILATIDREIRRIHGGLKRRVGS